MQYLKRLILIVLLASVLISCAPTEVVLPPDDPNTIANGGDPVFRSLEQEPGILAMLLALTSECPLYQGNNRNVFFEKSGITDNPLAVIEICQSFYAIDNASLAIAAVSAIPAAIEPTELGEATVGTIRIGGKLTGVIFVYSAVAVTFAASTLEDIVDEVIITTTVMPEIATIDLEWDGQNAPEVIPEQLVNDIRSPGHHIQDHRTGKCMADIAGRVTPHRVYFSFHAYNKAVAVPSVMFAWNAERLIKQIAGDEGNCKDLEQKLKEEYSDRQYPGFKVWLLLIMRQDTRGTGRLIGITAYPVVHELFQPHLCEWNYTLMLYPDKKPICGGPKP